MKFRSPICTRFSAGLIATTLALTWPATARGGDGDASSSSAGAATLPVLTGELARPLVPGLVRLGPGLAPGPSAGAVDLNARAIFLRAGTYAHAPRLFGPAPSEIRLSRGAKTAIIVGAIVVGVLLVAGVVIIAKPGKHP